MKLYTGTGDTGMTSLLNETKVSKADDRIELLGTIDELSSNIGLAKCGKRRTKTRIICDSTGTAYSDGRNCRLCECRLRVNNEANYLY